MGLSGKSLTFLKKSFKENLDFNVYCYDFVQHNEHKAHSPLLHSRKRNCSPDSPEVKMKEGWNDRGQKTAAELKNLRTLKEKRAHY